MHMQTLHRTAQLESPTKNLAANRSLLMSDEFESIIPNIYSLGVFSLSQYSP